MLTQITKHALRGLRFSKLRPALIQLGIFARQQLLNTRNRLHCERGQVLRSRDCHFKASAQLRRQAAAFLQTQQHAVPGFAMRQLRQLDSGNGLLIPGQTTHANTRHKQGMPWKWNGSRAIHGLKSMHSSRICWKNIF